MSFELQRARKRAGAQTAGDGVERDLGDRRLMRPGLAAVGRAERPDRPLQGLEGHDHRSVCLDDRLAAESVRLARWVDRRRPRGSAVDGRAHVLEVVLREVVELRVAVAVKRAGRGVVAGRPVLVEVDRPDRRRRNGHRVAPTRPTVRRAAHEDVRHDKRRRLDRDRGDHPYVVARVIGDARVAHPLERAAGQAGSAGRRGQAGQEAARPARAVVGRRRDTDIRPAAVEEPPDLEGGHHGRTARERVGLDLCRMLTRRVRERVRADAGGRPGDRRCC